METRKPKVKLTGGDGNAMALIAKCTMALRQSGHDQAAIERFQADAISGDYDHVIQTCMKYCDVN